MASTFRRKKRSSRNRPAATAFVEVGVCKRHDARVHAKRFGAAQALEAALFEHAQQFCLHARSKRRHFIENDRAALRHFEAARLARHGAGESAALVAKKLRFHQLRRKAGAIDFQERRVAAGAMVVDPAGQLIFARAAFPGNQKVGRCFGKFLRGFEDSQRGRLGGYPSNRCGRCCGHCCGYCCVLLRSDSPRASGGVPGAGKSTRSACRHSRSRS